MALLVEHTFVTTRPREVALQTAAQTLSLLGFRSDSSQTADQLRFVRGVRKISKATRGDLLPQTAVVSFDRGRIAVALSIEESRALRAEAGLHRDMLVGLAALLENRVVHDVPIEHARAAWDAVHRELDAHHERRKRRALLLLGFVCFNILVFIYFVWKFMQSHD